MTFESLTSFWNWFIISASNIKHEIEFHTHNRFFRSDTNTLRTVMQSGNSILIRFAQRMIFY